MSLKYADEPNMSDSTLLLTVEDLINQAMGPPGANVVDFKLVQVILQILARQQRMLQQKVEIQITELAETMPSKKSKGKSSEETTESSSSKSARSPGRRRMAGIKEEREMEQKTEIDKQKEKDEPLEKGRIGKIKAKDQEKEEKLASKERAKADKKDQKEKTEKLHTKEAEKIVSKEKTDKSGSKGKSGKLVSKEKDEKIVTKEKPEKLAPKEKDKTQKIAEKSKKEVEKTAEKGKKSSAKDQEKSDKEKGRTDKDQRDDSRSKSPIKKEEKKSAADVSSGISVKESKHGKENVIIVEKGPTTRTDSHGRVNIDVVTRSQFAILEAAIKELQNVAVPKPLSMPENEELRKDLVKGTASLPDAMEAMQVLARMKAAEAAIQRMSGLLTQLAAVGEVPEHLSDVGDVSDTVEEREDRTPAESVKSPASVLPRKSVVIDPKVSQASNLSAKSSVASRLEARPSTVSSVAIPRPSQVSARPSQISARPSILSKPSSMTMEGPGITHEEMDSALRVLRDDISKSLNAAVNRAAVAAENALHTAVNVSNKLDVALRLDTRISTLYTIVGDYSDQLSGFDAGLTTQMQSFKDQIAQMRTDLNSGLLQLENVNNNAETAAVLELTERYSELVVDLDSTMTAHTALEQLQGRLAGELHSLVECVEMLREQKSDRDEVLDGLRDKADISRLAGLLSEEQFATARSDFERRLDLCHDKFNRQDAMWTTAIQDLSRLTDRKAELIELLSARDATQKQLQELHDRLREMAVALGEPKAALLTRQLARDASCGACGTAALMDPQDAEAGAPFRLPPLRTEPELEPAKERCERWFVAEPPLDRHVCRRWAGGSHTLLSATGRERAAPVDLRDTRTRKYTGLGDDGRLYMMEEDLEPCVECNLMSTDVPGDAAPATDGGAGDTR